MFKDCNQCCAPEDDFEGCGNAACTGCSVCDSRTSRTAGVFEEEQVSMHTHRESHSHSESSQQVITERADRTRTVALGEKVEREMLKCVTYQPVDTITKTVEVPVVKTIEKRVPKVEYREKIIEVPKIETIYKEKVVEHPQIHYVDKIVEVPKVIYQNKYVDKVETVEQTVEREVESVKYVDKFVQVPAKREVFKYQEREFVEEYTHRVPNAPRQGIASASAYLQNSQQRIEQNVQGSQDRSEQDRSQQEQANQARFHQEQMQQTRIQQERINQDRLQQEHQQHLQQQHQQMQQGQMHMLPPTQIHHQPAQHSQQTLHQIHQQQQLHQQQFHQQFRQQQIHQHQTQAQQTQVQKGESPRAQQQRMQQERILQEQVQESEQRRIESEVESERMKQVSDVYVSAQMGESVNVQVSESMYSGSVPPPQPQIEQVFRPQVVQNVEIQKHIPISVDVPVAYMVPKPVVVPVQVPVLKFKDNFVPVPVRRRVIPRIKWTNEIFEVECIKEMPYLQIQDIVKPVPCDVEIKVHEFVDKAVPINPTELSQGDIHAMWMRVNADLAEKRKEELGEDYPYVNHPDGTVFGEPGVEQAPKEGEEGGAEQTGEAAIDPLALHPGHPLSMTYLQNQWMKSSTMETHKMYSPEWFESHQRALRGMETGNPTQVLMSPEQAEQLRPQDGAAFGSTPWMGPEDETSNSPRGSPRND